ncbi:MAG TPA: ABC transporter permease subunit [Ornithinimicrobium sp.]|uniref:ABC transporter permease subunit n=1 Tax=Ornithinimicrobium sp. TaxID=1977084 RepID=UPI002B485840|nr:ABC transporter permease subunit [Ornithinimicrobium sp.]HKJ13078.1 ABC transporter permease subunit [Ornithinimicrobium sp.]
MTATVQTATAPPTRETTRPRAPIPLTRLVGVELTKMFDTRSGFWLMAAVGLLSLVATASVIAFAPDPVITYDAFAQAVGIPMSIILPIIAILSVTGEYSQRTALSTFALVPRRGRVIGAKAVAALIVGVAGMLVALGVGALGNVVGSAITGVDLVWDISATRFATILLANVLGMAIGFMLGVVIRSSPGAIVGYFVFALVLPGVFGTLAAFQDWFLDLQPWVDVNFAMTRLYEDGMTGEMWAQLGVTSLIWIFVPMAIGLRFVLRSEVK